MDKTTRWASTFFVPVGCFLLFNVGDYIGRTLAGLVQLPKPSMTGSYVTLGLSILRYSKTVQMFLFIEIYLFFLDLSSSLSSSSAT